MEWSHVVWCFHIQGFESWIFNFAGEKIVTYFVCLYVSLYRRIDWCFSFCASATNTAESYKNYSNNDQQAYGWSEKNLTSCLFEVCSWIDTINSIHSFRCSILKFYLWTFWIIFLYISFPFKIDLIIFLRHSYMRNVYIFVHHHQNKKQKIYLPFVWRLLNTCIKSTHAISKMKRLTLFLVDLTLSLAFDRCPQTIQFD